VRFFYLFPEQSLVSCLHLLLCSFHFEICLIVVGGCFAGSLLEMSRECTVREAFSKHSLGLYGKLWRMCMSGFLAILVEVGAEYRVFFDIMRGSSFKASASKTWDFEGYLMLKYAPIFNSHVVGRQFFESLCLGPFFLSLCSRSGGTLSTSTSWTLFWSECLDCRAG